MVSISVKEFNSEVEGLNTLPPARIGETLIVFYSNVISSFHKVITVDKSELPIGGTLNQREKFLKWKESDFLHFENGERVPFRSFIHINSKVEHACTDRDKIQSETITYLLNLE